MRKKKTYNLPLSGQIIGEIFRILQIPYPTSFPKTVQRYFHGDRISDDDREEVLYALADALLGDGALSKPDVFESAFDCDWCDWPIKKQLVHSVSRYADRWDTTCARLRYWPMRRWQREGLLLSCLRLATIDLALRFAALRHMMQLPPPRQVTPFWAKRDGNARYLKHLKQRCSGKPSNAELAEAAGVTSDNTKDNWFYKGQRPSKEHLPELARAFAERIPELTPESLLEEMNRHYTLAALCHRLSERIEWDRVMELVGALYHQTARLQNFFQQDSRPVEQNLTHYWLYFTMGTQYGTRDPSLQYLWETEKDSEWKQDMVCVAGDWTVRIIQANLGIAGDSMLAREEYAGRFTGAHVDCISGTFIDHMIEGEMALWEGAGSEAYAWGEKTEAQFRRAVQSNPNSAQAHLDLGAYLGMNAFFNPSRIREGIEECNKAIALQPTWEAPWIEGATILLQLGHPSEALAALEQAREALDRISPRLDYTVGFAKMMAEDYQGALEMFEQALARKPDYALAFDNAAYCCFHQGDTIKGRRYAKTARQLGVCAAYDMYVVGKQDRESQDQIYPTFCETVPCTRVDCPGREEAKEQRDRLYPKSSPITGRFISGEFSRLMDGLTSGTSEGAKARNQESFVDEIARLIDDLPGDTLHFLEED